MSQSYSYTNFNSLFNTINQDPIIDYLEAVGIRQGYVPDYDLPGFDPRFQMVEYLRQQTSKFKELLFSVVKVNTTVLFNHTLRLKMNDVYTVTGNVLRDTFGENDVNINTLYPLLIVYKKDNEVSSNKFDLLRASFQMNALGVDRCFVVYKPTKDNESVLKSLRVIKDAKGHFFGKIQGYVKEYRKIQDAINSNRLIIGENLFPNMKNKHDYPWHNAKKQISHNIKELTLIAYLPLKSRNELVQYGIRDYLHPDLKTEAFMKEESLRFEIVDRVIKAQKGGSGGGVVILPDLTSISLQNNCIEFFVDFETAGSLHDTFKRFPYPDTRDVIFNVGVYWRLKNARGKETHGFESFWLPKSNLNTLKREFYRKERQMLNSVVKFMGKKCKEVGKTLKDITTKVYHYTDAEVHWWKRCQERHRKLSDLNWYDLAKPFRESFAMKGVTDFKLKSITRALHDANKISVEWKHSFSDGLGAMIAYINPEVPEELIKDEIIEYNRIDCLALMELKKLCEQVEEK